MATKENLRKAMGNLKGKKNEVEFSTFINSLGVEFVIGLQRSSDIDDDEKLTDAVNDSEILTEAQKEQFLTDIS